MNTQDEQIFDELMRQKLGNYTESPDEEILSRIHFKKNRVTRLYRLFSISAIIVIFGLMLAVYLLNHHSTPSVHRANHPSLKFFQTSQNFIPQIAGHSSTDHGYYHHEKILVNESNQNTQSDVLRVQSLSNKITESRLKNNNLYIPVRFNSSSFLSNQEDVRRNLMIDTTKKSIQIIERTGCIASFGYHFENDGTFEFINSSISNPHASTFWNFGDGSTSYESNPSHHFEQTGTYEVKLILTDEGSSCSDETIKIISVKNSVAVTKGNFILQGAVFAGIEPSRNSNVALLKYRVEANDYLELLVIRTNISGEYTFNDLLPGHYLIIAKSDDLNYMSTYYGNNTEKNQAVDILVTEAGGSELRGYDIRLVINKDFTYPGSGSTTWMDSINFHNILVYDPLTKTILTLSMDNAGNLTSGKLPPGNYQSVNPLDGTGGSIHISSDGSVTQSPLAASGYISIYPNPAENSIRFNVTSQNDGNADITILNSSGLVVKQLQIPCIQGNNPVDLDILNIAPGIYYVIVCLDEGRQVLSSRIMKTTGRSVKD